MHLLCHEVHVLVFTKIVQRNINELNTELATGYYKYACITDRTCFPFETIFPISCESLLRQAISGFEIGSQCSYLKHYVQHIIVSAKITLVNIKCALRRHDWT